MRVILDNACRSLPWLFLLAMLPVAAAAGVPVEAGPSDIDTRPFRASINHIEREHGALDYRLAEHFLSLGLAHRANGDVENAVAAFRQALHINRINKGLHHLMHVPIVDLLIDAYAQLQDWEAVERQHRYRYWIHRREVAENSDQFVDAAIAFANWETQASNLETDLLSFRQLRDAQDALSRAFETVAAGDAAGDPRMVRILNLQAMANLNLALHVSNTEVDPVTGGPVAGETVSDIIERRNLILECFIRGKQALEQVVNISETEALTIQHGLALANLADWELIFERTQSATKNYRRAYELLKAAGLSEEELAIEFERPRKLSQFTVTRRTQGEAIASGGEVPYVMASFNVTLTGRARNVEVVEAKPADNSRMIRRARVSLRDTRFRPRITEEGPVEATSTIRYEFPDESI